MELGHAGQIITTKKSIKYFIQEIQVSVAYNTVYLISDGLLGQYDKLRLYSTCSRLYYLSKLVYESKNGVSKLEPELAYAFDYVIKNRGELRNPEFLAEWSMFPCNYENYNYTEGIAEYFEDVMEGIF